MAKLFKQPTRFRDARRIGAPLRLPGTEEYMAHLQLSIALSDNELTRPMLEGRHPPQGVDLIPMSIFPSEMFWRQLKHEEFDICEMSLSSLMIAASRGDRRFVALPVFTSRSFFHTRILVRNDAGIGTPEDLVGKKIGVPEYQQTSAVWSRGVLQHEFGVYARDIEWHMERVPEKSHGGSTGFRPPQGVRIHQIPETRNIGEMLLSRELDGTLHYLSDRNAIDRSRADIAEICRPLFADQIQESRRYFRKSGVFPINHAVIVKRALCETYPWLPLNLFQAFVSAKAEVDANFRRTLHNHLVCGSIERNDAKPFLEDPAPYGCSAAMPVLQTLSTYLLEQGLVERAVDPASLFAPSLSSL